MCCRRVCLLRRADAAAVIGAALEAGAAGDGHRKIAGLVERQASTVRGWLRRFAGRAEAVRVFFTVLVARRTDPVMPASAAGAGGGCCVRGRGGGRGGGAVAAAR